MEIPNRPIFGEEIEWGIKILPIKEYQGQMVLLINSINNLMKK